MKPTRIVLITLAALMFPVGLGAAVYATAGRSLAQPPEALVSVSSNPVAQPVTTTDDPTDISGPCDEAEHRNDPRCAPGAVADEDRGGHGRNRGRGGDDDDRSGNSGPGSSNSGDDDRGSDDSGSGSSGSGHSGSDDSGSDDSGSDDSGSDDSGSDDSGSDDSGSGGHGSDD